MIKSINYLIKKGISLSVFFSVRKVQTYHTNLIYFIWSLWMCFIWSLLKGFISSNCIVSAARWYESIKWFSVNQSSRLCRQNLYEIPLILTILWSVCTTDNQQVMNRIYSRFLPRGLTFSKFLQFLLSCHDGQFSWYSFKLSKY